MGPNALRNQYGDFLGSGQLPVLEEVFRSELELHPSRREALFEVKKTVRDIWQSTEMHDMPLYREVAEGEAYSFERAMQGASKTLIPVKKGLGFSISDEAVEDGKFDFIADALRKMAESARESQEIDAMNVINNGFSSETTADGVAIFSTAHTLPRGLTLRNKLSTDADLSVTSLEQALSDFEECFIGDNGSYKLIKPRVLLVHSSNRRYAQELIGSELKADSADNNMNSFKGEGLMVMSSPHLTDRDAWFLAAAPAKTGLRIISRKGIETKGAGADVGFLNDAVYYKSRYREKVGAIHPYGLFGSQGA